MLRITYSNKTSVFEYPGVTQAQAAASLFNHLQYFRRETVDGAERDVVLGTVTATWIDDNDPNKTAPVAVPATYPRAPRPTT